MSITSERVTIDLLRRVAALTAAGSSDAAIASTLIGEGFSVPREQPVNGDARLGRYPHGYAFATDPAAPGRWTGAAVAALKLTAVYVVGRRPSGHPPQQPRRRSPTGCRRSLGQRRHPPAAGSGVVGISAPGEPPGPRPHLLVEPIERSVQNDAQAGRAVKPSWAETDKFNSTLAVHGLRCRGGPQRRQELAHSGSDATRAARGGCSSPTGGRLERGQ